VTGCQTWRAGPLTSLTPQIQETSVGSFSFHDHDASEWRGVAQAGGPARGLGGARPRRRGILGPARGQLLVEGQLRVGPPVLKGTGMWRVGKARPPARSSLGGGMPRAVEPAKVISNNKGLWVSGFGEPHRLGGGRQRCAVSGYSDLQKCSRATTKSQVTVLITRGMCDKPEAPWCITTHARCSCNHTRSQNHLVLEVAIRFSLARASGLGRFRSALHHGTASASLTMIKFS